MTIGEAATFSYNGPNHRVKKVVGATVTTSFFDEQWRELESAGGEGTAVYVWGLRYLDDLLFREKAGAVKLYVFADSNWNAAALAIRGAAIGCYIAERMSYDAFGKVNWLDANFGTKTNSGYNWNRTFTGQVLDAETGLMLYRNRYYHPTLGRFVSRDPIGYEANDVSLYRYVGNRTTIGFDVYGLDGFLFNCYDAGAEFYFPPPSKPQTNFFYDYRANGRGSWYPDHVYIRCGPLDQYGKPHIDTKGIGIGPTQKKGCGPNNNDSKYKGFRPNSSTPLCKSKCREIKHGSGSGKSGNEATDAEIVDCLESYPASKDYSHAFYNCRTWAREAMAACGLEFCGRGASTTWDPVPPDWTQSSPP